MKLIKLLIATVGLCTVFSCGTGMRVSSKKLSGIDTAVTYSITNMGAKKAKGSSKPEEASLLQLLNIFDVKTDTVHLHFSSDQNLIVSYKDSLGVVTKNFDGVFKSKGYFEIYHSKQKIEIPPLFPILYSKVHIDRIRINLTNDNELLVDNFYETGGNIFILAGGHAYRDQFYFKKL